jgi:FtsH-binding integral membrane protein
LSRIIDRTLNYANGGELIMLAVGGTATIFAAMAGLAGFIKRDLSFMGKFLTIAAVALLVASIASVFLNIPGFALVLTVICLVLFSAWLMYDLNQIINGGETNYITATLSVYLNVYNIFSSLLSLLGLTGRDD